MEAVVFLILGVVVALGTSLVKQDSWSLKRKQTLAAFLSLLGGVVTAYFSKNGTVELGNTLQSSATLLAVAQLAYSYALKNTKLNKFLTGINLSGTLSDTKTVEEAIVEVVEEVVAPAPVVQKPTKKKVATGAKTV
jgi:hypothetical protein